MLTRLLRFVMLQDECWVWTGSKTRYDGNGYGRTRVNGKKVVAHRAVYEALVGPIPAGMTLDHLCRNRLCVNPAHLEPTTMQENFLRGASLLAAQAQQTHCKRGHPLEGGNLSITNKGRSRRCKTCHRERTRARRAKVQA